MSSSSKVSRKGADSSGQGVNALNEILLDSVRSVPLGKQNMEGVEVDLPPVLLGQYGSDPKKKTILVYGASLKLPNLAFLELTFGRSGHYDVQPVR
jgi:hypothetical protein